MQRSRGTLEACSSWHVAWCIPDTQEVASMSGLWSRSTTFRSLTGVQQCYISREVRALLDWEPRTHKILIKGTMRIRMTGKCISTMSLKFNACSKSFHGPRWRHHFCRSGPLHYSLFRQNEYLRSWYCIVLHFVSSFLASAMYTYISVSCQISLFRRSGLFFPLPQSFH